MQLTEETARHLGVVDRLDAKSSAIGAARYLADSRPSCRRASPSRIERGSRSPRSTSASLISRTRASSRSGRSSNPDLWSDVRKVLPLLAEPEYYIGAKYGYARGGMPVAFVGRVRAYYDILLRSEARGTPRLQARAGAVR